MEKQDRPSNLIVVDAASPDPEALEPAAVLIRQGGIVAFPTETVYGLGADATNPTAVNRIFAAKGRPADNPLIVHIASREDVALIAASVPPRAEELMERFWPGPLTLVLPKRPDIPDNVTCGLKSVGVRMPSHPIALELIRLSQTPVAAPSANLSGRPSPTTAEHVAEDLAGRVDLIIDGGETGVGLESTVLDMTSDPPALLRPGGVTLEELVAVLGPITVDGSVHGEELGESPRSPGMKYTHYAPKAKMILVDGPLLRVQERVRDLIYEYEEEGRRVGVMCSAESRGVYQAPIVLEFGSRNDLATVASDLFSTLRAFDRHGVDVVVAEGVPVHGLGLAVMNRMIRAAGGQVVRV